jgi:hypothetical protein
LAIQKRIRASAIIARGTKQRNRNTEEASHRPWNGSTLCPFDSTKQCSNPKERFESEMLPPTKQDRDRSIREKYREDAKSVVVENDGSPGERLAPMPDFANPNERCRRGQIRGLTCR